MRFLAPAFAASLLILTACNSNTANVQPDDESNSSSSVDAMMDGSDHSDAMMPSSDEGDAMMQQSSEDAMMKDESSAAGTDSSKQAAAPSDARVIDMTVTDWSFAPNAIVAKKGEKIVVRMKDMEGEHSFVIAELGVNVAINPGESKDVVIPTDKPGTYTFRCRIPCGPGHKDMMGTLTVS